MTQLHTSFISGAIFTAGSNYAGVGPSGINEITNRINTHTHDGGDTPDLRHTATFSQTGSVEANNALVIVGSVVLTNIVARQPVIFTACGMQWGNFSLDEGDYRIVGSQAGFGTFSTADTGIGGSKAPFPGWNTHFTLTMPTESTNDVVGFYIADTRTESDNYWTGSAFITALQPL